MDAQAFFPSPFLPLPSPSPPLPLEKLWEQHNILGRDADFPSPAFSSKWYPGNNSLIYQRKELEMDLMQDKEYQLHSGATRDQQDVSSKWLQVQTQARPHQLPKASISVAWVQGDETKGHSGHFPWHASTEPVLWRSCVLGRVTVLTQNTPLVKSTCLLRALYGSQSFSYFFQALLQPDVS